MAVRCPPCGLRRPAASCQPVSFVGRHQGPGTFKLAGGWTAEVTKIGELRYRAQIIGHDGVAAMLTDPRAASAVVAGSAAGYRVHVSTRAELRRMRRIDRWMEIILPTVVRRVVNGQVAQPGWLPRRWLSLVSGDVDLDAGIGAVCLVWRPGSPKAETHTALMERCGEKWQHTGGGSTSGGDLPAERLAAGRPGQVGMIEIGGGAGALSYAYRLRHPDFMGAAPWVGSNELQAAAEVDHLLLGDRRIEVPGHGRLIVVWKSPSTGHVGIRPLIVAVGRDGTELSRIGPHDSVDSYTWARLHGPEGQ
ncbi:hypothetical protein [Streptomyces sp. NPDC053427]|uniref:hypothetical protein n=1 Tax=Streptomyces sp. NPDC053427 TaxID=3365701 RepID=UPI0037D25156